MTINANLETAKLEFAEAAKGMRNPTVMVLRAGDALFRFACTKNPQSGVDNFGFPTD